MGTVKRVLLCIMFFPAMLFAQNEESGSVVVKTDEGFRISQIISFPAVPNTLRYEVEIEEPQDGGFVPLVKESTETNRVEVTLRAGSYRYRYMAFNMMNLPEGISEWQEFTIRPAVQPAAETYQPFYGFYYEMADPSGSIVVNGSNFSAESEFALVSHRNNFDWSGVVLEHSRNAILPDEVTVEGDTRATLSFARKRLKRGEYDIFIRNPGGLWTVLGQVRVGFRKNTDFTLSFGYAPMIAAFDHENAYKDSGSGRRQRLDTFNPVGYYLRLGWIPVKSRLGNLGLELGGYFLADKIVREDREDGQFWLSDFDAWSAVTLNLLYQTRVGRFQHNIRLGSGFSEKYHTPDDYDKDVLPFLINFGLSTQYFIWKNFYAEAGIDLQFVLGVNHLVFRPTIGLGWQFGKWAEHSQIEEGAKAGEDYSVPVKDIPKNEFTLSLGWYPMVPLFGMDLYNYHTVYDGVRDVREKGDRALYPFNPLGMDLRAAYIPYRWGRNKLGMEFNFAILDYPARLDDADNGPAILSLITFGVLYQRNIAESWQLNIRAGAGISHPYPYGPGDNGDEKIAFAFATGISAQYFFWKNAYVEAGFDFVTTFGQKQHGMLRPGIFLGWQFNRNAETGLRLKGTGLPRLRKSAASKNPPAALPAETIQPPSEVPVLSSEPENLNLPPDTGTNTLSSNVNETDAADNLQSIFDADSFESEPEHI